MPRHSKRFFSYIMGVFLGLIATYSMASSDEKCFVSEDLTNLLAGKNKLALVTHENPFSVLAQHDNVDTIIWLTTLDADQSALGLFTIQRQGKKSDITVIATSCDSLNTDLEFVARAVRQVINDEIPLSPDAHFVTDMGLSFDQIIELQNAAYVLAGKSQPDELFETMTELAQNIAVAQPLPTSRSVDEKEFYVQTVYYGTTRSPEKENDNYYGALRDITQPLHMGMAKVSIPKNHKKGHIEQPFLSIKWLKQSNDHVLIQSVTEMSVDDFWTSLPVEQGVGEWKQSIIVYIHGYNVAFGSAIKRTAQMAYDFDYSGVPVLFSWPSNASLLGYASDREDAIWSATYLADFLTTLDSQFPNANIHIVAHSMGNQVLLNALNELALQEQSKSLQFGSVILAAPDVDSEWFQYQLAPRINRLATNWAIYTSENDGALIASEKVNQVRRLGMPVSLVDNFDIVDTSELNAAPWSIPESHSYYANKLPVIKDLVDHLRGIPPAKRSLKKMTKKEGTYWQMLEQED